jgi:quinohemoprotein ethanol dehydrogenase
MELKMNGLANIITRFFLVVLGLVVASPLAWPTGASGRTANVTSQRIIRADDEPGNWLTTGRTYTEQRFSPLSVISAENVSKLGLAWTYKLDVDRGVEATPVVVDGIMYTTGPFSIVYALDAATGTLLWKYDPGGPRAKAVDACCDVVNRGVAVRSGKVYVGTFDGRLIALDAMSGKEIWFIDTALKQFHSYSITGAPLVVKDKILIGNGGGEFGVRGYLSAYDAETGKLAWRFFTVPGDPKHRPENAAMAMALKTWHGSAFAVQGGGGTVWNTIVYDPELDLVYFGTGNGVSWNRKARGQTPEDSNLFLSSIVAVNADTGAYVWHYQEVPGDIWDYDADANIILANLTINGKQRKVLMQAAKNGFFYVLDRATGKLLSADKYATVNWATGVDLKTGKPQVDAQAADWTTGPKVVSPSPMGAHNWQPMSYSPVTALVYIPQQESAGLLAPDNDVKFNGREGVWNLGTQPTALPEDPSQLEPIAKSFKGKLMAWDPAGRKSVWIHEYATIWNGGTLTTAGNLVFQGTADGHVVAYAADTGAKLWESPGNTGVMAGPITYTVNGEQYVTFMAGWGGAFPLAFGGISQYAKVRPEARIVTYKQGGTAVLPAPMNLPVSVPEPPALTADDQTIARGRDLFNGNCGFCHGFSAMSGGVIPDLRYLSAGKHGLFSDVVNGAYAPLGMPSFANRLNSGDIDAIHQYLIKRTMDLRKELGRPGQSAP